MSSSLPIDGIYFGERSTKFKTFILTILKMSKLRSKYIDILTDPESMNIYNSVFTSELVDMKNNYQVFEQLGDLSCNKFVVSYMYKRFPQLLCADGVKVVARLRINYVSKESFSTIANKLGFWYFISAPYEIRKHKMKDLLEDVFEAFIGATEYILDTRIRFGVGYSIIYNILSSIFDTIDISFDYNKLFDSKTRLKELFDCFENKLGQLKYKTKVIDRTDTSSQITETSIFRVEQFKYNIKLDGKLDKKNPIKGSGSEIFICSEKAILKNDSEQKAAEKAIDILNSQGFSKTLSSIYTRLSSSSDDISINYSWDSSLSSNNINDLISTKPKLKYQNKYKSPILSFYLHSRDLSLITKCLSLSPSFSIKDTDGIYPLDHLFIGERNESLLTPILDLLLNFSISNNLKYPLSNSVYLSYYTLYISNQYFIDFKNYISIISDII